jgi:hypothetical protein
VRNANNQQQQQQQQSIRTLHGVLYCMPSEHSNSYFWGFKIQATCIAFNIRTSRRCHICTSRSAALFARRAAINDAKMYANFSFSFHYSHVIDSHVIDGVEGVHHRALARLVPAVRFVASNLPPGGRHGQWIYVVVDEKMHVVLLVVAATRIAGPLHPLLEAETQQQRRWVLRYRTDVASFLGAAFALLELHLHFFVAYLEFAPLP